MIIGIVINNYRNYASNKWQVINDYRNYGIMYIFECFNVDENQVRND
jgi:hypothetical protein